MVAKVFSEACGARLLTQPPAAQMGGGGLRIVRELKEKKEIP